MTMANPEGSQAWKEKQQRSLQALKDHIEEYTDPSTLTNEYLKGVSDRIRLGTASPQDYLYQSEILRRKNGQQKWSGSTGFTLGAKSVLHNVIQVATFGVNNGIRGVQSFDNVMAAGMEFVGPNAEKVYAAESGRFIGWQSTDGLKLFRPPVIKQKMGGII